jgi:hypothetical protein
MTGVLGKRTFKETFIVESDCSSTIGQVANDAGTITDDIGTFSLTRNLSHLLQNIGALDLINTLLRTCQWFIDDIDNKRVNYFSKSNVGGTFPGNVSNTNTTFSDAATPGALKFTDLQYSSTVQNTFTEVQVAPLDLATQVATSGSAPYNTLVYNTYNLTTADALSLAGYIINMQSVATAVPFTITTNTMAADTCTNISVLSTTDSFSDTTLPVFLGSAVTVIFRGTTVTAQIQGINTTFYPDYATVKLFLSPSLGTPFTLNSSAFGVLDTNRLGYP